MALLLSSGAAAEATPDDPAQLLKHADDIKTADNAAFSALLKRLDAESPRLTPPQAMYLRFLEAWQTGYYGNYEAAIPQLNAIAHDSSDVTIRFRAGMTAVNLLAISKRYEIAYSQLSQMLELLPQVSDRKARQQGLGVATGLYGQAGQLDLALSYADKLIEEEPQGHGHCAGGSHRIDALYENGKFDDVMAESPEWINACVKASEPLWANLIRAKVANVEIQRGQTGAAIELLRANYDDVQRTHYAELIADVDSAMARAQWQADDVSQAQHYAQRVVDGGIKNEYTEALVRAYEVLYQVAQKQGDYQAALTWHEKFAAADKGYLNLTSARMLAYQMVKQQMQEKKLQVDALSKQNQMLQLRQTVNKKDAEARDLYLAMLVLLLGSIALYAYRTKRSQLKFMKLAQRDGLTGIFNRQHFIEASRHALADGAKSVHDASMIVIDLDHFKQINDDHGHAAGDIVLKRAVMACAQHLRSMDVFGRLGGEEFGILMPDCVPERAFDIAESMRKQVAGLSEPGEDAIEFPVHASFGISAARWSGYDLRQLLAHADSALYQAKREGRNRVCVYDRDAANARPDRRQQGT